MLEDMMIMIMIMYDERKDDDFGMQNPKFKILIIFTNVDLAFLKRLTLFICIEKVLAIADLSELCH